MRWDGFSVELDSSSVSNQGISVVGRRLNVAYMGVMNCSLYPIYFENVDDPRYSVFIFV